MRFTLRGLGRCDTINLPSMGSRPRRNEYEYEDDLPQNKEPSMAVTYKYIKENIKKKKKKTDNEYVNSTPLVCWVDVTQSIFASGQQTQKGRV